MEKFQQAVYRLVDGTRIMRWVEVGPPIVSDVRDLGPDCIVFLTSHNHKLYDLPPSMAGWCLIAGRCELLSEFRVRVERGA